jgi:putative resolvase
MPTNCPPARSLCGNLLFLLLGWPSMRGSPLPTKRTMPPGKWHAGSEYAAARGYQVVAEVTEIASGLNDERPKLNKLLTNPKIGVLVVEHKDRLTRFGYGSIATLLEQQGRRVEAMYPSDTGDDLVDDCVAVITSMAARISGRRNSKRRAAQIKACIEHAMQEGDA